MSTSIPSTTASNITITGDPRVNITCDTIGLKVVSIYFIFFYSYLFFSYVIIDDYVTIVGLTFLNCGTAIQSYQAGTVISGCTFVGNNVSVYISGSDFVMQNSLVLDNELQLPNGTGVSAQKM